MVTNAFLKGNLWTHGLSVRGFSAANDLSRTDTPTSINALTDAITRVAGTVPAHVSRRLIGCGETV
jgi:hypothetical protein